MKADLVAYTILSNIFFEDDHDLGYTLHDLWNDPMVDDADELAEFAGRACYQSWDRPNPATATNEGYLKHILEVGHFSILEHASATFYLRGVSRSFTHELVRHRHLSFSQVSQRYVDESDAGLVLPPGGDELEATLIREHHERSKHLYRKLVQRRLEQGQQRKQAREAGRAVLSNATETKIVVTGNMRAWREVIAKRNTPQADAAFRENAATLLELLRELAPNTFQDL